MGLTVAELVATLGLDSSEFDRGVGGAPSKMGAIGAAAVAASAVAVAALAAIAVAAVKLGGDFDDAYDTIRIGTGATGDVLEELKDDFREVVKSVPTDFGSAGVAIADLNTRLGLTGKPLQDLAGQFLDLSRITGSDLATNIATGTRVIGDWNVAAEDQSRVLDALFRGTQASGLGFSELSGMVVQFGAPLRNLGFDLDTSIALFAQFEKAGVNTQTVFAGLKAGIGKMAKAGEAAPETFRRIVSEIERLGPGADATGLAIELFGQRAGPDLADAIIGGKFNIEAMYEAIAGGSDTIGKAADDTADWLEQLTVLKNRALVGLEPALTAAFNAVGDGLAVVEAIAGNPAVQEFFRSIGREVMAAWEIASPILQRIIEFLGPRLEAAVSDVLPDLRAFAQEVAKTIADVGQRIVALVAFIEQNWGTIGPIVEAVWAIVSGIVRTALKIILGLLKTALALLRGDWGAAWNHMKGVVDAAWNGINAAVRGALGILKSLLRGLAGKILGWIGDLGSTLKSAGRDLIQGLINGIREKLGALADIVREAASKAKEGFKSLLGIDSPSKVFAGYGRNLMEGLALGISGAARLPQSALLGVPLSPGASMLAGAAGGQFIVQSGAVQISVAGGVRSDADLATIEDTTLRGLEQLYWAIKSK